VIRVLEVKRENGKVIMVVALINNYIESTWIKRDDGKIMEISRISYNSRFLDRDILYIEKEEYKKSMRIIYAIFNSNKAGRK
jgi:hypothetical protein